MKYFFHIVALSAGVSIGSNVYSHHLIKEPIRGDQAKRTFERSENYDHYINYFTLDTESRIYRINDHYDRKLVDRFPGDIPLHNSYLNGYSTLYMDWDGEDLSPTEHDFCGEPKWSRECYPIFTNEKLTESNKKYIADTHRFTGYMYLPFDINVTSDPDIWAATPEVNRSIAIHSRSLHSPSAGAVSGTFFGVGHFTGIFRDRLGYAAPHEFGHQFGVGHQYLTEGRSFPSTYISNLPKWMSIWNPSTSGILQWTKGEYSDSWFESRHLNGIPIADGATDSLAQIARYVGYRADDHAGFSEYATPLAPNSPTRGMIARNTDTDWFILTPAENSELSIEVEPDIIIWTSNRRNSSLDVAVKLYDSNMNLITESNPDDTIVANIRLTTEELEGFTSPFYLEVDGVGLGTPLLDQEPRWGYTDYGSLGPYTISADFEAELVTDDPHGMQIKTFDQFAESISDLNLIEPREISTIKKFSDIDLSSITDDVSYQIKTIIEIPPLPRGQTNDFDYTFEIQTNIGALGDLILSNANSDEVLVLTSSDIQHPDNADINVKTLAYFHQLPPYEPESGLVKNAKSVSLPPGLYTLTVFYANELNEQIDPYLDVRYRSSEVSLRKFFKSLPEGILYAPASEATPISTTPESEDSSSGGGSTNWALLLLFSGFAGLIRIFRKTRIL